MYGVLRACLLVALQFSVGVPYAQDRIIDCFLVMPVQTKIVVIPWVGKLRSLNQSSSSWASGYVSIARLPAA